MRALLLALLVASVCLAWDCPNCGTANDGELCVRCGLPEPPAGMVFIPERTVNIDGMEVHVAPFFIDTEPVESRDLLDWLSSELTTIEDIPLILGGQEELLMPGDAISDSYAGVVFMRYTPWVFYMDAQGTVTGVTVQTGCFDMPAVSVTKEGASRYLEDTGRRLPTLAEITAASDAGFVGLHDAWESISSYSDFIEMTLSGILGVSVSGLSMFAPGARPQDRVMWEWTGDSWGQSSGSPADPDSPYAVLFRPTDPPETGTALRSIGYYNLIFRGVVPIPWFGE